MPRIHCSVQSSPVARVVESLAQVLSAGFRCDITQCTISDRLALAGAQIAHLDAGERVEAV